MFKFSESLFRAVKIGSKYSNRACLNFNSGLYNSFQLRRFSNENNIINKWKNAAAFTKNMNVEKSKLSGNEALAVSLSVVSPEISPNLGSIEGKKSVNSKQNLRSFGMKVGIFGMKVVILVVGCFSAAYCYFFHANKKTQFIQYSSGNTYEGQVKNGLPHGKGAMLRRYFKGLYSVFEVGDFLMGEFVRGDQFHFVFSNGKNVIILHYVGEFENEKACGYGVLSITFGNHIKNIFAGEFVRGAFTHGIAVLPVYTKLGEKIKGYIQLDPKVGIEFGKFGIIRIHSTRNVNNTRKYITEKTFVFSKFFSVSDIVVDFFVAICSSFKNLVWWNFIVYLLK